MDMDITGRWRELPSVLWHEIRRDYRKNPFGTIVMWSYFVVLCYLIFLH